LRALGGGRQRTGRGLELRRSGGYGLDNFSDQRFEVARDAVHPASALDLGFGVERRGFIGRFLRNQGLLEQLQRVGHRANLGFLTLMRYLRGQVAVTQRLHGGHNRGNRARDIANQISTDGYSEDDGDAQYAREDRERRRVVVRRVPACLIGAGVVEFDILLQDGIRSSPILFTVFEFSSCASWGICPTLLRDSAMTSWVPFL
jgi:hypothetical protein